MLTFVFFITFSLHHPLLHFLLPHLFVSYLKHYLITLSGKLSYLHHSISYFITSFFFPSLNALPFHFLLNSSLYFLLHRFTSYFITLLLTSSLYFLLHHFTSYLFTLLFLSSLYFILYRPTSYYIALLFNSSLYYVTHLMHYSLLHYFTSYFISLLLNSSHYPLPPPFFHLLKRGAMIIRR